MNELSVIVITFNRLEYTQKTIKSLFETVPEAEFIVVDNQSTEQGFHEYLDWLSSQNVTVIRKETNTGWGDAVNVGLSFSTRPIVLISNNDVLYSKNWYEKTSSVLKQHGDIGIFGVWQHVAHGMIDDKGEYITKTNMPAVGWLMKRDTINLIGEFPTHGPCFTKGGNGEDTSYCLRAMEKGFTLACFKEDVANHFDGY